MNLHFDIVEIVSATMVLFAVIDIIGSVPIIINLRKKAGRIQSEKTAIVAGVLLVLFLFIGKQLQYCHSELNTKLKISLWLLLSTLSSCI